MAISKYTMILAVLPIISSDGIRRRVIPVEPSGIHYTAAQNDVCRVIIDNLLRERERASRAGNAARVRAIDAQIVQIRRAGR
jgi:hypothetical protein